MVFDEIDGGFAVLEGFIFQQVEQKADVGVDAADSELAQCPVQALAGAFEGAPPGGDFHQQGIEIGRYFCARKSTASVKANAETGSRAVGHEGAIVRFEVVLRHFSGDAALDCITTDFHIFLSLNKNHRMVEGVALRYQNLHPNQVNAGDFFGDGMLYLNPGVHFDEIDIFRFVYQKLDGSCTGIVDRAR